MSLFYSFRGVNNAQDSHIYTDLIQMHHKTKDIKECQSSRQEEFFQVYF